MAFDWRFALRACQILDSGCGGELFGVWLRLALGTGAGLGGGLRLGRHRALGHLDVIVALLARQIRFASDIIVNLSG